MLRALIFFLLFSISYSVYANIESQSRRCRTSPVEEPARESRSYQDLNHQGNSLKLFQLKKNISCRVSLQNIQDESLQKVQELQKDPGFQEIVTELQKNSPQSQNTAVNSSPETKGDLREASLFDANLNEASLNKASLYIFVSFSLGEKALLNIAQDAKRFGATLVLRGFLEGSFLKTAQSLQNIIIKTGQGVIIDPELYSLFNITAVPTMVLAKPFNLNTAERIQTPIHDKLQGHVSTQYALETFEKEGDLKREAHALLKRALLKREVFK